MTEPTRVPFTVFASPATQLEVHAEDGKRYPVTIRVSILDALDLHQLGPDGLPILQVNATLLVAVEKPRDA